MHRFLNRFNCLQKKRQNHYPQEEEEEEGEGEREINEEEKEELEVEKEKLVVGYRNVLQIFRNALQS